MPFPALAIAIPAAVAGGGMIIDQISGNKSRRNAMDQFHAQMDTTIQRRVADAKKAQVSPWLALGSPAGASPTIHAGGQSDSGARAAQAINQTIGGAVQRAGQKGLIDSQIKANLGSAARDETQAQYNLSRIARDDQAAGSSNTGPGIVTGPDGMVDVQPPIQSTFHTKKVGTDPAKNPMFTTFVDSEGKEHKLPTEQFAQVIEDAGSVVAAQQWLKREWAEFKARGRAENNPVWRFKDWINKKLKSSPPRSPRPRNRGRQNPQRKGPNY